MKKVAWVFIVAVIAPSLALAWLALRSINDQGVVIRDQKAGLCQFYADEYADFIGQTISRREIEFAEKVQQLLAETPAARLAPTFDEHIRECWPEAEVGFSVSLQTFTCPSPAANDRPEARDFRIQNLQFLCSVNPDEVFWSPKSLVGLPKTKQEMLKRKVIPQSGDASPNNKTTFSTTAPDSAVAATTANFKEIVGNDSRGILARFLQNELNVWTWSRGAGDSNTVFGAKLDLNRFTAFLRQRIEQPREAELTDYWRKGGPVFSVEGVCLAVLNDKGLPVARTHRTFNADWRRPFVATEIGDMLPHWEVAVYLLDPGSLTHSAVTARSTILLLVVVLTLAIGVGSWLIVADLKRQLGLARQKTDFVSNVSHELKTPLTSIRMFSELLAEDRAESPEKRRKFLGIITAETARLTRLINNVLDFSRMERGEKKYDFKECDLSEIVTAAAESCRPHLEEAGFAFDCETPDDPISIRADQDALSQVILNLLSNAEKYSRARKEVTLRVVSKTRPAGHAEIQVLDRGSGVPGGSEERIFEKFHRAEDSLDSGIEGSGLGLTLARQIARAHGGDIACRPRDGGGSVFTCTLPILKDKA